MLPEYERADRGDVLRAGAVLLKNRGDNGVNGSAKDRES
jgi:hypothetical protein